MNTSDRGVASGVKVIARAAAILRELKGEPAGLSLGQLATRLGLPRSTVQRIVGALQQERLLVVTASGRGIRLGPEVEALARSARSDIAGALRPFLVELSERTGETVDLAVLQGRRVVFIDQVPGRHRLRTVSSIGDSFPLVTTANGKATLACLHPEARRHLVEFDLRESRGTVSGPSRLLRELDDVIRSGIAFDLDEHTLGVSAVGAAIPAIDGEIYSVSVPVPSARFAQHQDEIVAAFSEVVDRIRELDVVAPATAARAITRASG